VTHANTNDSSISPQVMSKTKIRLETEELTSTLSEKEQNFLLAQYSALREEVLKRIELQHQLLLGSVVTVGTVLTISTQGGSPAVLVLYPFLAMFLTLAWSQNDNRVRQITTHIAKQERSFLNDLTLGWEHSRSSSRLWILGSRKVFAARGIFVGSQILTLLYFWLRVRQLSPVLSLDDAVMLSAGIVMCLFSLLIIGFPSRR
jgi:hypothetical protein